MRTALTGVFHLDPVPQLMRSYVPAGDGELRRSAENLSATVAGLPTERQLRLLKGLVDIADESIVNLRIEESSLADVMMALDERFGDRTYVTPAREMSDGMLRFAALAAAPERLMTANTPMILPVAVIVETGNHIAQVGDGTRRRVAAGRFHQHLRLVAEDRAPWTLFEPLWDRAFLQALLAGDSTGSDLQSILSTGLGAGDLSTLVERDRYRARVRTAEVTIWTLDRQLNAYN